METSEKIFSRDTNMLLQGHQISEIVGSSRPKIIQMLHLQGLFGTFVGCHYVKQSSSLSFFKKNIIRNGLK